VNSFEPGSSFVVVVVVVVRLTMATSLLLLLRECPWWRYEPVQTPVVPAAAVAAVPVRMVAVTVTVATPTTTHFTVVDRNLNERQRLLFDFDLA